MTTEKNRPAKQNAKAHAESIADLMGAYRTLTDTTLIDPDPIEIDGETFTDPDCVLERMYETPLCVEYRSDWYSPGRGLGENNATPSEYRITLTTGGPGLQIVGTLDEHGEPDTARMEYRDWGTPWTAYRPLAHDPMIVDIATEAAILDFARLVACWSG